MTRVGVQIKHYAARRPPEEEEQGMCVVLFHKKGRVVKCTRPHPRTKYR